MSKYTYKLLRRLPDVSKNLEVKVASIPEAGLGVFAAEPIKKGEHIITYTGHLYDESQDYQPWHDKVVLLPSDKGVQISVDPLCPGSPGSGAEFINHACFPNCEIVFPEREGASYPEFYALRDIEEGEEITFDYQLTDGGEPTLQECIENWPCFCGHPMCRKTTAHIPLKDWGEWIERCRASGYDPFI